MDQALSVKDIQAAFASYRARMRLTTQDAVAYFGKDIPGVAAHSIGVAFDMLDPAVIQAVKELDDRMLNTLAADLRETVRQAIQAGLEAGVGPRTIARELREIIGLAPNQEQAVRNFQRALEGDASAGNPLDRKLRDRRFDATIRKGALTGEQVDKMTSAYRRRMLAFNAETNARTATLDSLKLGQNLAWEDAVQAGIIDRASLVKQWKGVMDDREREEHVAMEGETVGFDDFYSNGEQIPGESTFNCRCLSIVYATA